MPIFEPCCIRATAPLPPPPGSPARGGGDSGGRPPRPVAPAPEPGPRTARPTLRGPGRLDPGYSLRSSRGDKGGVAPGAGDDGGISSTSRAVTFAIHYSPTTGHRPLPPSSRVAAKPRIEGRRRPVWCGVVWCGVSSFDTLLLSRALLRMRGGGYRSAAREGGKAGAGARRCPPLPLGGRGRGRAFRRDEPLPVLPPSLRRGETVVSCSRKGGVRTQWRGRPGGSDIP